MIINLPWPHSDLSPNSRVHWNKKAKRAKIHRTAAHVLTMEALMGSKITLPNEPEPIRVALVFVPPSGRAYDLDGLISRAKSSLDGIADALGVNDRRFRFAAIDLLPASRGAGKLIVMIQHQEIDNAKP